jgi:hypothetical protein
MFTLYSSNYYLAVIKLKDTTDVLNPKEKFAFRTIQVEFTDNNKLQEMLTKELIAVLEYFNSHNCDINLQTLTKIN